MSIRRASHPRLVKLLRSVDGHCSPGDAAVIVAADSIIWLYERLIDAGNGGATGLLPRYTVPIGLVNSAVLALVQTPSSGDVIWTPRAIALQWSAIPDPDDSLGAEATVSAVSGRDALCAVRCATLGGKQILSGTVRAVPTSNGAYAATAGAHLETLRECEPRASASPAMSPADNSTSVERQAEPEHPPLASFRNAEVSFDRGAATVLAFPDWTQLFCSPIAGHAEPIGRRTHPLGGYAISAAILAAALAQTQRADTALNMPPLLSIDLVIRNQWTLDTTLRAGAFCHEQGTIVVRVVRADGVAVLTGTCTFPR